MRRSGEPFFLSDTARRLRAEFEIDEQGADTMLLQCLDDLRGSPVGALPELVERLARQRLLDSTEGALAS